MSQKKRDRTEQYETAVKTAILNDMVAEEIQQMKFDSLVKKGIIRTDDRRTKTACHGCTGNIQHTIWQEDA